MTGGQEALTACAAQHYELQFGERSSWQPRSQSEASAGMSAVGRESGTAAPVTPGRASCRQGGGHDLG